MNKDKKRLKQPSVFVLNSCCQYLLKILVKKSLFGSCPYYQIKLKNFKQFDNNKKKKLIMKIY